MDIFGDVLYIIEGDSQKTIDIEYLIEVLKRPVIKPRFSISILYPDESVNYKIPDEDITIDGISYTENYAQGQRRNITLKLININGQYTPSINKLWADTKFRFDVGIELENNQTIWFSRGTYVMGNVDLTRGNSEKTVTVQLKDKFAIFEDKTGTLENSYEIPVGTPIQNAIEGILNFDSGNGYILDYKKIILDEFFRGFVTQNTIRKEEGETLGAIILELATQMSAECFYNTNGNLCFIPINESIDDSNKPIIWTYKNWDRDMHNMNLNYSIDEIINVIKVVGDNVDYGVFSAIATNNNSDSPICIERIGRRTGSKISDANIWSNDIAESLAKYHLRKSSFINVKFSAPVSFNPFLMVNNICEVEDDFLNLEREKLLLNSISYSSPDGQMTVELTNTKELPFS